MPDTGYEEPDLDFAALRQELRESVRTPDFAALRRRGRRRRRHRLVGGGGVVLAVVALIAGLVLLTPSHRSTGPTGSGATGTSTPTFNGTFGAWATSDVALDSETPQGYALQVRCAPGGSLCEGRVLTTPDSGKHWTPGGRLPDDATGMLSNGLTPQIINPALYVLLDGYWQPALVSTDAGAHWQRPQDSGGRPVPAVDAGARWYVTPRASPAYVDGLTSQNNRVLAYDLAAGTVGPLASQPPIDHLTDARLVGTQTIWATGLNNHAAFVTTTTRTDIGVPVLAASPDGGRTWGVTVLGGPDMNSVLIGDVNGSHGVLLGRRWSDGDRWHTKQPLSALWSTGDGGRTFTDVPPGSGRPQSANDTVVLSDGRTSCSPPIRRSRCACGRARHPLERTSRRLRRASC